ncbi:hypothetical protein ACFSJ3_10020 [Corallincola platygyrae]|uniref:Ankyrin repeat domain-containing protein n=1 Tax=Corallincola platygyrae TaxID=1193278 RepID=A0ABW4XQL9_9GAMM
MSLLRGLIILGILLLGFVSYLLLAPTSLPPRPSINPALLPNDSTPLEDAVQNSSNKPLETVLKAQAECEASELSFYQASVEAGETIHSQLTLAIDEGLSVGALQLLKQSLQPHELWQFSRTPESALENQVELPDVQQLALIGRLKQRVAAQDWEGLLSDIESGDIDLSYPINEWSVLPGVEIDPPAFKLNRTLGVMLMLDRGNRFPNSLLEAISERYQPSEDELISLLLMDSGNQASLNSSPWLAKYREGVSQGFYEPGGLLRAAAQQGDMLLLQQAFDLGATVDAGPDEATALEHALAGLARFDSADPTMFQQSYGSIIELLIDQGDSASVRRPDGNYDLMHLWAWNQDLTEETAALLAGLEIPQRNIESALSGEQLQRLQLLREQLSVSFKSLEQIKDAERIEIACAETLERLLGHDAAQWQAFDSFDELKSLDSVAPEAEERLLDDLYAKDPSLVDARLLSMTPEEPYQDSESRRSSMDELTSPDFVTLLQALQQSETDWRLQLRDYLTNNNLSEPQLNALFKMAYSRVDANGTSPELNVLVGLGFLPQYDEVVAMVSFNQFTTLRALNNAGLDLNNYYDAAGRPLSFSAIQNGYPELSFWLVEQAVTETLEPRSSDPLDALLEQFAEDGTHPLWLAQMPMLLRQVEVRESHLNRMAALKFLRPQRFQQLVTRYPSLTPLASNRPLRLDGIRW